MNNQHSLLKTPRRRALTSRYFVSAPKRSAKRPQQMTRTSLRTLCAQLCRRLPLLEKVARQSPNDPAILDDWALRFRLRATEKKIPKKSSSFAPSKQLAAEISIAATTAT